MKKELKKVLYHDLERYIGDQKSKIRLLYYRHYFLNRGFKYTVLKKKTEFYKDKSVLLFLYNRLLLRKYSSKYGFQIPYDVRIGKGFFISHWGRIIINEEAILGDNLTISTGVVIGKEFRGIRAGAPIINNDVYIGANAVIVGKVSIGSNVLIAPNSFINFDVPNNSIVIGNPARIISDKENATEGYIFNRINI